MVERRPIFNLFCHVILVLGIASIALPVWIAIVATTHENSAFSTGTPLWFGDLGFSVFAELLGNASTVNNTELPITGMLFNSLVMALCIT